MQELFASTVFYRIVSVEVLAYLLGCVLSFVVFDQITKQRRPFLPVSYSNRRLQLVGMALVWPLFIVLLPISALALIVWMFIKASRQKP